jgi:alkanesulfonate monooxygenase SsuD/methylene tetrahydromethanopterin reductase-like flavin-dependent oxidoreductase (luciferase family)
MARPGLVKRLVEICVQTMTDYASTLRLARMCEAEGVPALAVADHYLTAPTTETTGRSPTLDQLVLLGGIARETTTVELVTLVSPLTFRHPAVHLKAAVTLDQMSGGRFGMGLGTGWMASEHTAFGLPFPETRERFERLEETLRYFRAALSGAGDGFEGRYYRLDPFTPLPVPENLRLVVGGGGARRTPELAGRYADEYNVFPAETPFEDRIATARAAATDAGRPPTAFSVSSAFPAALGATVEEANRRIGHYASRFRERPDTWAGEARELGVPVGTVEQTRAAFERLAEAGVTRVYLQMGADVDAAGRMIELARLASS